MIGSGTALNQQLVDELLARRRVIVTAPTAIRARRLFASFVEHLGTIEVAGAEEVVKIRRANGAERVEHPAGGRVVFGTIRGQRWHGYTADTLVIVGGASDAERASLFPTIGAAADPRVVEL